MEALSDEIDGGKSILLFKQFKKAIIDTAKNITSNDATFKTSTLPQVKDELAALMTNYTKAIQKVDACEKAFLSLKASVNPRQEVELPTFEENYNVEKENHLRVSELEQDALYSFESLITPAARDEEIVVEAPTEKTWPKDPITKTNIRKAVRNKKCNHIYDRDSIQSYIDTRSASHQRAPCPVAGCRNKSTEKKDLVPDDETNLLIESLRDSST